jgi:FkbM family methyltransferase
MDDFAQVVFYENGSRYRMAMPDIVHIHPLSYGLRRTVRKYFETMAQPRPIEYIVDVGACVGTFAIPVSIIFPKADILCLEPSMYNYPFLEFNTKRLPQIEALKLAAHNRSEVVRIAAPTIIQRSAADSEADTGLISIYGDDPKYSETVAADRLDNIVKRPVDWLKIDVEGHEIPVLEGAERILSEDKPILQIEFREENQNMAHTSSARLLLEIVKRNYVPAGSMRGDLIFRPGASL